MPHNVLQLFPDRGLDQSILIAVLIGVYVLLFFCEFFGWGWAGLVVPGYLASVFAVAPHAGYTICLEAILTFVLSRLVSDILCKLTGWSAFFGRERFFLIVMVSVLVRQSCELWFVAAALQSVDAVLGTRLAAFDDFSSIGLVLVPLLANMFWKLTLPRGVFQIGVAVAITYVILAFVLLPHTNLSFASFESTYEDVALDFLGSPKAYIILLTTAFAAAYGNLVYGWDYNGILVPSLLALTWFTPKTLGITIVEALVLLYATKTFVKLPLIKHLNLEGPRKVTTVFTVGFLLKFGVGWLLAWLAPSVRITEYFGFGYVLTSLLAVKMLTIKKIGRVMFPSIAVSLFGFIVGSAVGLMLHLWLPYFGTSTTNVPQALEAVHRLWRDDVSATAAASAQARYLAAPTTAQQQKAARAFWRSANELAVAGNLTGDLPSSPDIAALVTAATAARMRVISAGATQGRWLLTEQGDTSAIHSGAPTALWWPTRKGPLVLVAHPLRQPLAAQIGYRVCQAMDCRMLLVAGTDDAPTTYAASTQAALAQLALPVIEIELEIEKPDAATELQIAEPLPGNVALASLEALLPNPLRAVDVTWAPQQRRGSNNRVGWATLRLAHSDAGAVLSKAAMHANGATTQITDQVQAANDNVANDKLVDRTGSTLAPRAPSAPSAPSALDTPSAPSSLEQWVYQHRQQAVHATTTSAATELDYLVLQQQVIPQLLNPTLSRAWKSELAAAVGLQMSEVIDTGGRGDVLAFCGDADHQWFLLAVTTQVTTRALAMVAPVREEFGTSELATQAFLRSDASVLLINLVSRDADAAATQAATQAWFAAHLAVAQTWALPSATMVHFRGVSGARGLQTDLLVSLGRPVLDPQSVAAPLAALVAPAGSVGQFAQSQRWVDGQTDTVALLAASSPAMTYQRRLGGPTVLFAWFSEAARRRQLGGSTMSQPQSMAAALQLPFVNGEPERALTQALARAKRSNRAAYDQACQAALAYARTVDAALLTTLSAQAQGLVTLGYSPKQRRPYILISPPQLTPLPPGYLLWMGDNDPAAQPQLLEPAP